MAVMRAGKDLENGMREQKVLEWRHNAMRKIGRQSCIRKHSQTPQGALCLCKNKSEEGVKDTSWASRIGFMVPRS